MKIYCHICNRYMGEIRDGTIRKGTKYVCAECAKPKQDEFDFVAELKKAVGVK
jgi:transposase-like protein